jgi:hypothetical protein
MTRFSTQLTIVFLLGILVSSLFAQDRLEESRERVIQGISALQARIEYRMQSIERLLTLASEKDKEAVRTFLRRIEPKVEQVQSELETLKERVANATDAQLGSIDPQSKVLRLMEEFNTFEDALRKRLTLAKRVGHAIRVTDKALFRATKLAHKAKDGVEAFPRLRRAFELQEDAKQALANGRHEQAMKLTLRARDLIGETLRAALDSADIQEVKERFATFWKQTNRIIKRIEKVIDPAANPKAAKLLRMAKEEQRKAKELAENHPYRALDHARKARRIVNQMKKFHNRVEHFDERLAKLEEKIDEVEEVIDEADNEKASSIFEKGIRHFEKARELGEAGNTKAATAQLDIAVKLVTKAVSIAKGNTKRGLLTDREIRKTNLIVSRAADLATTEKQKQAVEQARALIAQAEEKKDNPSIALRFLDKATDIAFRVIAAARNEKMDSETEVIEMEAK